MADSRHTTVTAPGTDYSVVVSDDGDVNVTIGVGSSAVTLMIEEIREILRFADYVTQVP
jgi:hypothetical protein